MPSLHQYRFLAAIIIAALALAARAAPAVAQTEPAQPAAGRVAEHIARGDAAHAALEPVAALQHYEAALAEDSSSYDALWKASRELADLAEADPDRRKQTDMYRRAEAYARRAVAVRPADAEAHFHLARALGRVALTLGARDRVRYAVAIRDEALTALKYDSLHPGALHVMGRWNAEVMRLSGMERFFARKFLGGKVFSSASWDDAERYLERAVAVDPERLTHSLDLAEIYADRGKIAKAREQLQRVIEGRVTDYNDRHFKARAAELLRKLEGRRE